MSIVNAYFRFDFGSIHFVCFFFIRYLCASRFFAFCSRCVVDVVVGFILNILLFVQLEIERQREERACLSVPRTTQTVSVHKTHTFHVIDIDTHRFDDTLHSNEKKKTERKKTDKKMVYTRCQNCAEAER